MQESRSASFRIALRTADYEVAVRRAAKIGSWILRMKSAACIEEAIRDLFPKLQELSVQPAGNRIRPFQDAGGKAVLMKQCPVALGPTGGDFFGVDALCTLALSHAT
jgi:hypothetical protein